MTRNILLYLFRRHGTVLVLGGIAFAGPPDDEDDEAYDGNEGEKQPPAALVDVVQTTDAHAQVGQQNGQRPDNAQPHAHLAEQAEDKGDDQVEQEYFFTKRAYEESSLQDYLNAEEED